MFGTLWEREHGSTASAEFLEICGRFSKNELIRIMGKAREQIEQGNKFPPALGELMAWATTPSESEFLDVLIRVKNGEPTSKIEQWLVEKIKFNLTRTPENQEMKFLKKNYFYAVQLMRNGKLKTARDEILYLPRCSEKNKNDIQREVWEQKNGKSIHPRFKKLILENRTQGECGGDKSKTGASGLRK